MIIIPQFVILDEAKDYLKRFDKDPPVGNASKV
jgi:hypothetical protein